MKESLVLYGLSECSFFLSESDLTIYFNIPIIYHVQLDYETPKTIFSVIFKKWKNVIFTLLLLKKKNEIMKRYLNLQ